VKCPIDGATLVMSDRQGIEIDYCPECRGVWLDRGELDKIIDRSSGSFSESSDRPRQESHNPQRDPDLRSKHYDSDGYHHKKRKKEGFLGDLFDF
jgi:Zn-finger nucleic acid-binding protein